MSLSIEERVSGIYFAIKNIVSEAEPMQGYENLTDLVDKLWPAFLYKGNGSHWVLGSGSSNHLTGTSNDPWQVAIMGHLEECKDPNRKDDTEYIYDVFESGLDIGSLAGHDDNWHAGTDLKCIFSIYRWVEQLIYYLRRYDDKFLEQYKKLSDVVAQLQGECFHVFSCQENYAKAYVLHQICKIIWSSRYPYDEKQYDVVTKMAVDQTWQHYVTNVMHYRRGRDLYWLKQRHIELLKLIRDKKNAELLYMRLRTALELMNGTYHYKHQHDALLKAMKSSPLRGKTADIKVLCAKCVVVHDAEEKKTHEEYGFDTEELEAYGIY